MNFNNLNTYNNSYEKAFEAFCNQLFERWLPREYPGRVRYFTTVNGAGGDGGVEAYGVLDSNEVVGVQAKWFRSSLEASQIRQIRDSIQSAKTVRPQLTKYVVCLPRDFQSIKIGRGKLITTDCEEKRINALIDDIFTLYSDLELEFWNEHRIREELQHPGAENIQRFWFEKEELSIDYLKQRFSLAKAGWLKERYVSSLHTQGHIHQAVEEVLFTLTYRKKESVAVLRVIEETRLACNLIDAFDALAEGGNAFKSDLVSIRGNLQQFLVPLEQVYQALTHGDDALEVQVPEEVNVWATRLTIADAKLPNRFKNIQPRLVSALENANQTHLGQYISHVLANRRPHNKIVLGAPGTGKTHGVAEAVEERLASGMPALIIRAKGTPCHNWATILHSALSGLNHWSDVEIWSGLEALAVRADAYRALSFTAADDIQNETTRVLICIDGIDEAADIGAWRIRINELRVWIKMFPRLRFVVTSRSYPPANQNPCYIDLDEEINRRFDLPEDGDVALSELVPKYLNAYKIEFKDTPWIVDSFENALSLKLFCEQYHGQDLAKQSKPVHVGLTALLNAKIQRLEDEFFDKHGKVWSAKDQVLRRALFPLADALQHTPSCDHDSLCDHLITELKGLIDRRWAAELLEAFSDHGFLWRGEKTPV